MVTAINKDVIDPIVLMGMNTIQKIKYLTKPNKLVRLKADGITQYNYSLEKIQNLKNNKNNNEKQNIENNDNDDIDNDNENMTDELHELKVQRRIFSKHIQFLTDVLEFTDKQHIAAVFPMDLLTPIEIEWRKRNALS